jgi:hypothetical protein
VSLPLAGPDFRVFVDARPPSAQSRTPGVLSWALALLQSLPKRRAAASMRLGCPSHAAPPLRFPPLQRLPARRSGLPGLPHPGLASPGSPNLLTPKRRPMPAGHISDQIRSWGSPFRALLLPRSRTPSPAPLPSCRWHPAADSATRARRRGLRPAPDSERRNKSAGPRLQGLAPRESPPPRPTV